LILTLQQSLINRLDNAIQIIKNIVIVKANNVPPQLFQKIVRSASCSNSDFSLCVTPSISTMSFSEIQAESATYRYRVLTSKFELLKTTSAQFLPELTLSVSKIPTKRFYMFTGLPFTLSHELMLA